MTCPFCGSTRGIRVPADPWDRHEVCVECGGCRLHDLAPEPHSADTA